MKKTNKRLVISLLILIVLLAVFMPLSTNAATVKSFDTDLFYGLRSNEEVKMLQEFLKNQGHYGGPITGNFLSLTLTGVMRFQGANKVPATGYFGPQSRAVANKLIVGKLLDDSLTLVGPINGNIEVGAKQSIRWTSLNNSSDTVSIRLIRKVSDDPATYEVVREIAESTANDGTATWVPSKGDVGSNLFIEVGCATTDNACTAAVDTSSTLAVINSNRYANTASVFDAIENAENK